MTAASARLPREWVRGTAHHTRQVSALRVAAWPVLEACVTGEPVRTQSPWKRLSNSVPFVPPNPNEFDRAYSIRMGRFALAA